MKRFCILILMLICSQKVTAAADELGILSEANALYCSEVYRTVDDKKVDSIEAPLKSVLKIHFNKTRGFMLEGKKIYPAMSIKVTSKEGEEILFAENALSNFSEQGLPYIFSKKLTATIGVDEPMEVGKIYNVDIKISDTKGKGEIDYFTTFKVIEKKKREKVGVAKIDSQGLSLKYAMLIKGKEKAKFDLFEPGDTVKLYCAGVGEFEQGSDGFHAIEMDLLVKDSGGTIIKNAKGLLGDSGHIKLEKPTTSLTAKVDTKGYEPGKYYLMVTIYDKVADSKVIIEKPFGLIDIKSKS